MSTKEQYWKYSLITIIIGLGIILFLQITPFLGGLLGALTIYILVRRQMIHLTDKRKMKRSVAATLITTEAILFFLVPLALAVWLLVSKLQDINLDPTMHKKGESNSKHSGNHRFPDILCICPRNNQLLFHRQIYSGIGKNFSGRTLCPDL